MLPEKIRCQIAEKGYKTDSIGLSGASIFIYENMVLKVQDDQEEAKNEYLMMQYLYGKIPVPFVYAYEVSEGKSYLLMSKCAGEMACSDFYMDHPAIQCKLLAAGLKQLWDADSLDCPSNQSLSYKLDRAKYNIEHNLVDLDHVEPSTFGEHGFRNPSELLEWLNRNRPEEELVLSHGDYCLPNLFGVYDKVSGYIDLGRMGIADKWCDIALCYRSLSHNYSGRYHGKKYSGYDDLLLFRELGIEPDWKKIKYYILLDELF